MGYLDVVECVAVLARDHPEPVDEVAVEDEGPVVEEQCLERAEARLEILVRRRAGHGLAERRVCRKQHPFAVSQAGIAPANTIPARRAASPSDRCTILGRSRRR